jgi:membrane protease YdiL (CAAX protease family)
MICYAARKSENLEPLLECRSSNRLRSLMSSIAEITDSSPAKFPVPFYNSSWTTRSLVAGLAIISLLRASVFIDHSWLGYLPWIVSLVVYGLLPQIFLLLFPIITRIPRSRFFIPSWRRCLVEFGIAILVVIAVAIVAALVNFILDRISPGTSLEPEQFTRLSESSQTSLVLLILSFSFTFVPVAEELFFRGFLQNALRARLPWTLAIVTQSLIFGFGHTFGMVHSIAASVMGLILALVYEWRKTLITPMLIHGLSNALSALSVLLLALAYANSPVLGVGGDTKDAAVVVRLIVPDSAAEKAGLQIGDEIASFNGQPIRDFRQLAQSVRLHKAGDTIPVSVKRAGSSMTLNVVLQRRDQYR